MTNDTTSEGRGAVAGPLQRPVGRPEPERLADADMTALAAVAHQAGLSGIDLHALARVLDAAQRIAAAEERARWEAALRQTWKMVDPLKPDGQPGSYARGSHNGIVDALTTLRANLKPPNNTLTGAPGATEQGTT